MSKESQQKQHIARINMYKLGSMAQALEAYTRIRDKHPNKRQVISRKVYFPELEGENGEETQTDYSRILERLITTEMTPEGRFVSTIDNHYNLKASTQALLPTIAPEDYFRTIYQDIGGKKPVLSHASHLNISGSEVGLLKGLKESTFKINDYCQRTLSGLPVDALLFSKERRDQALISQFWGMFAELIEVVGLVIHEQEELIDVDDDGQVSALKGKEDEFRAYMTMASIMLDAIAGVNELLYALEPKKTGAVSFMDVYETAEDVEQGRPLGICITGSITTVHEENSHTTVSFSATISPRYLYNWLKTHHPKVIKHAFPRFLIWPTDIGQQAGTLLYILGDNPYVTSEMFSEFCKAQLQLHREQKLDTDNVLVVEYQKALARNVEQPKPEVEYSYESTMEEYTLRSAYAPEVMEVLVRALVIPTLSTSYTSKTS
jgi:hypothetical protein